MSGACLLYISMKSSVIFGIVQFDKTHSVDCCWLKGDSLPYTLHGKPKAKRRRFVDTGPGVECEWKGKALNLLTDVSLATPTLLSLGRVPSVCFREIHHRGRWDVLYSKLLRSTLSFAFCLPCFSTGSLASIFRWFYGPRQGDRFRQRGSSSLSTCA